MADFRPVEANKGHILMIRPAPAGTPIEDANAKRVGSSRTYQYELRELALHICAAWEGRWSPTVEWE